jgi:hypothetical protein
MFETNNSCFRRPTRDEARDAGTSQRWFVKIAVDEPMPSDGEPLLQPLRPQPVRRERESRQGEQLASRGRERHGITVTLCLGVRPPQAMSLVQVGDFALASDLDRDCNDAVKRGETRRLEGAQSLAWIAGIGPRNATQQPAPGSRSCVERRLLTRPDETTGTPEAPCATVFAGAAGGAGVETRGKP